MLIRQKPQFAQLGYHNSEKAFYLQWNLTSLCEGGCRFCYMSDAPDCQNESNNELTTNQCLKIIQDFSLFLKKNGFSGYVNLTGGDPLLKEGFWDILVALKNIGVEVGILGEPHLINPQTADRLKRYGIVHYQLSIDGVKETHDYFRGAGFFDKTWKAAQILRDNGINVSISLNLSKENRAELDEIIHLCYQNRINSFRPTRLIPGGKGKSMRQEMLSSSEYKEILFNTMRQISALNVKEGFLLKISVCDSLAIPLITGAEGNYISLLLKVILAHKKGCHTNFLALLPDGTIYPCRRLPIKIGNILEDSFEKAYNSELSVKLRTPQSYEKCSSCNCVALCQGGCPAVTYAVTGDPFGKDPQCWVDPSRNTPQPVPGKIKLNGSRLFQPLKVGSLTIKNRIFRSATLERVAKPDGGPTEEHLQIYRELAEGEAGLIITGVAYVAENAKINSGQSGIHQDYLINEWKQITDGVHSHSGKIAMQLTHQSIVDIPFRGELMGPSTHMHRSKVGYLIKSREMKEGEILTVIDQFVQAILRAEMAGFDAVQLQLAHSYLLGLFLSPHINLRKDRWGGSLENRLRITTEIVRRVKKELNNKEFPIMVKMNSSDGIPEGLNRQEASDAVSLLSASGVDVFELSGKIPVRTGINLSSGENECYFQKEGEYIRDKNPGVVLGMCGGIRSVDKMDELLKRGFDFVSMCRPFIREPDLVKKLKKYQNYKPQCISCSICYLKIKWSPLKCHLV
jgi:radical SAM protein with 4Fe4S-binding SPASM domain